MPRTRAAAAAATVPDTNEKASEPEKEIENEEKEGDDKKKHAELLALPPHGSEVYVGNIPQDATEEDLRGFCESIGEVVEVRIMKGKEPGENKGYAFVMFRTKEMASKAMEKLNGTELKGKKVRCSSSQAKHKLFIGNIPKTLGEEDLRNAVSEFGPGVIAIELLKDLQNSSRNRGFAFIEYYNHACADYARQKMSKADFRLGDKSPTVSWADPSPKSGSNAESSGVSEVKAVYVKNLPKDVTQDMLKDLFGRHGKITKVVLPPAKAGQENSRFGFVHFEERSSALKSLKNTGRYELEGQVLDCSLAKPQADKSSSGSNHQRSALLPNYGPRVGYGMFGGGYGAVGAGYGAPVTPGLTQPLLYGGGRGSGPAGMAMMPMLLPDGRIGYVLKDIAALSLLLLNNYCSLLSIFLLSDASNGNLPFWKEMS
uniref:RRM domain-containing protein n=1 Tax=Chenopodium quinoa TaxID=63459 RepID=A0A803MXV0_CHEQI